MGNKIDSNTKLKTLEYDILALSGLDVDHDIEVYDVPIWGDNYIHTIRCGDKNKEVILLVHGYGSTGLMYFKLLKELSEKYKVYCIDLIGMGMSSRPNFNCKNAIESIEFFTDSIEAWRIAVGLEQFALAGHSLGGHITCHYTHRYPKVVSKLLLISPLGFTNYNDGRKKLIKSKPSISDKMNIRMNKYLFSNQITMSHVVNKMCFIRQFLKCYLNMLSSQSSRIGNMTSEYLIETYKRPESSEKALFLVINADYDAHCPLEEIVQEMQDIPVIVFFGDQDWMDSIGAKILADKEVKQKNYELFFIKDAGHQIFMHNPKDLLELILREEEYKICL